MWLHIFHSNQVGATQGADQLIEQVETGVSPAWLE